MPAINIPLVTAVYLDPSLSTPGVDSLPTLTLTFSGDLLPSTYNTDIALNRGIRLYSTLDGSYIPITYVNYQNKQLQFKPTTPLSPGVYNVIVLASANGLLSMVGRSLTETKTFGFSVDGGLLELPIVYPISPANGGVSTLIPSLQVLVADLLPGSGSYGPSGTPINLHFELSTTPMFSSITWYGFVATSGNNSYSIQVPPILATNQTYYWRVRLESVIECGNWSDVQNFYYGQTADVYRDSRRQLPDRPPFELTSCTLADDTCNLATWPLIQLTFSDEVATSGTSGLTLEQFTFSITSVSVDGGVEISVPGTWTANSLYTIQWNPQAPNPAPNTRYTLNIPAGSITSVDGIAFTEPFSTYWTSKYAPLYALPIQMRNLFGSLVEDVTEDHLYFQLYRSSLDANFRNRLLPSFGLDPIFFPIVPQISQLRTTELHDLYPVHLWVLYDAMIHVLELKLYEFVPTADGDLQIADYKETISSANVLKFITEQIKSLKQRKHDYEAFFQRRMTRPRTGLKSSWYGQVPESWIDGGYTSRKRF